MTYCVGMQLNNGLIFMSDTRTNAGVDNISTFRKMFTFEAPGERCITLMTAGNLATTQAVISMLEERTKAPDNRSPSILEAPSMFQVARLIGDTLREVIARNADAGQRADSTFNATVLVGGQIKGSPPRMFLIYPEGNFIEASDDTPFFQIGETKYGRPILVRAYDPDMSWEAAVKLLLVSFDSTIKANLSVGLPLDLQIYTTDSYQRGLSKRITAEDASFRSITDGWGDALKAAFDSLPEISL
ncbi:proteasome-type protease [Marivivens sp. JLT3646]|uniref:proteasome-type protease n=1 Tax=Marivivens sp. JLT3646 TaxID=1920883 RepID=UPI0007FE0735|nr:proteasome-type protease [Marivivens sp. JLT3646]APO87948.1 peptidase [Marivivens sp. JLT3646]NVK07408.1 proteasome-type protease [Marivivens sp.]OBR35129.1 peptidase [Donghicola sp. JL3646]